MTRRSWRGAVITMIALGIWQIDRARQKDDLIALYRANLAKPAMSFPDLGPVPRDAMFRPSSVTCIEVMGWRTAGGRSVDGVSGSRYIAECRTVPRPRHDRPWVARIRAQPRCRAGRKRMITTEPTNQRDARCLGRKHPGPMRVADQPATAFVLRPSKPRPRPTSRQLCRPWCSSPLGSII